MGEIATNFSYGLNASAKTYDGKHKYLRITDIDENTHVFKTDNLTTPSVQLKNSSEYVLKKNDLLFARTGASTGKSFLYHESDGMVYFAGFLIRAQINPKYDAEFIFQCTLTPKFSNFVIVMSQRSGQPGINAKEYSSFIVDIPKLAEQKSIGGVFTSIDALIAANEDHLKLSIKIECNLEDKLIITS